MALYHTFYIDLRPLPPWNHVLREFLLAMGRAEAMSSIVPEGTGGYVGWDEPYCLISCGPLPEESYKRELLRDELGITVNFNLGFRYRSTVPWIPEILRGVNHLLGESSRDAAFLFNGEYVWLMRRAGKIYLNNTDPGLWIPERLQFITQPYEMIKIPVL